MTSAPASDKPASRPIFDWQPTWEAAFLFPEQGDWTVEEYLALDTMRKVEYSDGVLEFVHTDDEPQPPADLVAAYPNVTWEIAYLLPAQGDWSVDEYMDLRPRRRVEYADGFIEVLPMPKYSHQKILRYLLHLLETFVFGQNLGEVMFSPLRVQVRPGKFREPDILFMKTENLARCQEDAWLGADLVIEIVSDDSKSRKRDLEKKAPDYAGAGILEYWIVDPLEECVTVFRLEGQAYQLHGEFRRGVQATSLVLTGLSVDVSAVFDAGRA